MQARKNRVKIQAIDSQGNPLPNATISLFQKSSSFPFGSGISKDILTNTAYQNWFLSKPFTVTVLGNEMKWYSNEYSQGHEDYTDADALLKFTQQHNIALRGHNIFWDDPNFQPSWVPSLSPDQLNTAVQKRLNDVVSRYKGQLIAWDVVNENLHFSFFESKLGSGDFSGRVFHDAHAIDGGVTLFMNDFNTIEYAGDGSSTPAKYIDKLKQIQGYNGNQGLTIGIGLEGHFTNPPDLAYIRASIDTLAATGSPVWITELDVSSQPKQVLNKTCFLDQK